MKECNMRGSLLVALAGALTLFAACEDSSQTAQNTGPADAPASAKPAWLLTSAPAGAIDVSDAKSSASEGDDIVLRGIIGGRVDVLTEDSATFVIMDTGLENACVAEDDHCPTPWDYCCATADDLAANNATIQLVDDSGAPLDVNLVAAGLEPLDQVVVVGKVGPRPTGQVLTVRASGVHREGG